MINLQYFELKINPYFVWKKALLQSAAKM